MGSNEQPKNTGVVLEVGIIGAGVSGLAAAIGLCRAGHNVEMFERSRFANELGAAINVCPNASRLLDQWGFDWKRANSCFVNEGCVMSAKTLENFYHGEYNDFPEKFGAPWWFLHRVDLHNELKRLAMNPGDGFTGAKIRLSAEVKDIDSDSGKITLADGTTVTKDLIIGADGVHSLVAEKVFGLGSSPDKTGQAIYRFIIPTEKISHIASVKPLFRKDPIGIYVAADPVRRMVWYPCRNGELQNFAAIHPDRKHAGEREEWDVSASVEDLVNEYKDFHPDLVEVCRQAEDLKMWPLLYRKPNPIWCKGKVALAGDAIHPMLPHQGQGGAIAIEDGGALGTLFADLPSKDAIPERLKMYQEVRKDRAAAIQVFSNAGQEEADKVEAEAKQYVKGPVPKNQAEYHQYNFTHDVIKASQEILAKGLA